MCCTRQTAHTFRELGDVVTPLTDSGLTHYLPPKYQSEDVLQI